MHTAINTTLPRGLAAVALLALSTTAPAQKEDKSKLPELRQCAAPIGTVAIEDAQYPWWRDYGLGNPEALIKMFAQRSRCLRVVDRGRGLAMRSAERDLADSGELRRGSNVGKGQIAAADYAIVPDIVAQDRNAGGMGGGGLLGGRVGGRIGGLLGGVRTKRLEAQTLITLIDLRTTEQLYVAEGNAKKTDFSFAGAGGVVGAIGAIGGYGDTEIGRVISHAYAIAFNDLVDYMQALDRDASAEAGIQAYTVTQPIELKRTPAESSGAVRSFAVGELVYPTGGKEGIWWEVEDENGNAGWVSSAAISPRGL